MIFVLLPFALLVAALAYQSIGAARDRRRYPPVGRVINAGAAHLHVHESGQGSPVVVLESGIGASSLSWIVVQPKIANFARVFSYDRAGLGWSAPARAPRTVAAIVNELRSLLSQVKAPPPYVLVGHSFGALVVRAYASMFPGDVAGLVLVDPVSVAMWANCSAAELQRLRLGVRLAKRGAWAARLGLVRAALAALIAGGRGFPKLAARTGGRRGSAFLTNLAGEIRKLPREVWPIVCCHWSDPKCFRALADYLDSLPENAKSSAQMPALRGTPTIVLSASNATEEELAERGEWVRESGLGKHIRAAGAGHWLHLEQPDLIAEAVREAIQLARKDGLLKK